MEHSDACHERFRKFLEDEAIANREKAKAKAEAARLASEVSAPAVPVLTSKRNALPRRNALRSSFQGSRGAI